jgi:dienelactone hydrolase
MKNLFLLVAAIILFFAVQAQLKPVGYNDGSQKLNGYYVRAANPSKNKAGVLILPAWMGIDDHAKTTAERLGALGYQAFVADIYGEGNYPKDQKSAGAQAGYYKSHREEYRKRIRLATEQLVLNGADPKRIVVIGYCFGGTGALEAARANMPVKGVVSFHGGLSRDTTKVIANIQPKILVCHGADDFYESLPEQEAFKQEMRDANADWQMVYYANAVHSFTDPNAGSDNSKGAAYNEKAATRSWQHMLDFLDEALR